MYYNTLFEKKQPFFVRKFKFLIHFSSFCYNLLTGAQEKGSIFVNFSMWLVVDKNRHTRYREGSKKRVWEKKETLPQKMTIVSKTSSPKRDIIQLRKREEQAPPLLKKQKEQKITKSNSLGRVLSFAHKGEQIYKPGSVLGSHLSWPRVAAAARCHLHGTAEQAVCPSAVLLRIGFTQR